TPPGVAFRLRRVMPMPPTVRLNTVCSRVRYRLLPLFTILLVLTLVGAADLAYAQTGASVDGPVPTPLFLFPASNWWNTDITHAPIDTNSGNFITFIGATRRLHPDWGGSAGDPDDPNGIYGIPYISVPGTQPLVPVTFVAYGDESDDGAP